MLTDARRAEALAQLQAIHAAPDTATQLAAMKVAAETARARREAIAARRASC